MTRAVAILLFLTACQAGPRGCIKHPAVAFASAGPKAPKVVRGRATQVYEAQLAVINHSIGLWGTSDVEVTWRPCDEENSYYNPNGPIELCTEMEQYPDAALFYAAHEAGHAATFELAGSLDEASADEIGALTMIDMGKRAELLGAALYYKKKLQQAHPRGDGHPGAKYRAWLLVCLEDGSEERPNNPACGELYRSTLAKWRFRLSEPQYDAP